MKKIYWLAIFIAFIVLFFMPSNTLAASFADDRVVFGGTYTLESGETQDGDIIIMGGIATIEEGSIVKGSIVLFGGNIDVNGDVLNDIVAFGGLVNLEENAVIRGDVVAFGAHLERAQGAQVEGSINSEITAPFSLKIPQVLTAPRFEFGFHPVLNFVWFMLRVFLWAAFAILAVMFFPKQVHQVGDLALSQPVSSAGLGCLTLIVAPFLLVVLAITIILLPVSLLTALVLIVALVMSILSLGLQTGKKLASLFSKEWPDAISAGVGTFLLVLVIDGVREVVPCIGWIMPLFVAMVGLGAVVITRFGTEQGSKIIVPKPPAPPQPSTPAQPPEAEIPPALSRADPSTEQDNN